MTHYDLKRSCCAICLGALLISCGNQSLYAVDRLVPGAFATVQAAEAASSPGDRIIVSPGTYVTPAAGLVIDVANLQLLSTGGFASTTIRNNNADEPVIEIDAPGVIIGDVGQGFTIEQLTPGPSAVAHNGEVCILIHGDQVKFANPVRVQYNRLSGNQNDEGILIDPFIEAGGLIIQENTFVRNAGTFAFTDAIHFHYADHPSPNVGDVSLFDASVDILNNDGTEIDRGGVFVHNVVYQSTVNISGNDFSFVDSATDDRGAWFESDVDTFSTLNITNNTFDNAAYPIFVDQLQNQSTCLIQFNTFNNFRDYGIEIYTRYGCSLTISENTISGNGTSNEGIQFDTTYGSEALVSGNAISGVDEYGMYIDDNDYGSSVVISDNTISSATQLDYGISTDTDYGSATTITGNTISGWDQYGIYEAYPSETSTYVVANNTLTADSAGGDYGIYLSDPSYDVVVTINNNTCTNFDTAGININEPEEGATFVCNGNTLTALAAGADYGIYIEDIYNATTVTADGNTIGGFDSAGIRTGQCSNRAELNLTNNTLTALATGADFGIYNHSVHTGASMNVTGNTVSGYGNSGGSEAGFYQDDGTYDGSILILANNTFAAHDLGSEDGFLSDYGLSGGSEVHIVNNTFTGYTNIGMYSDFCGAGSILSVAGNTFTPKGDESGYGVYLNSGVEGTSQANISNNIVNGFTDAGIWVDDIDGGSRMSCNYNEVNGKATGGGHVGIYIDQYTDNGSYFEAIGNSIGSILGDAANYSGGLFFGQFIDNGSEAVVCNNFIRGLPGQIGDYMVGIYFYYAAQGGSEITICNNDVAGFEDAAILFDGDFADGSECNITENILSGGHYGIGTDTYNIGSGSIVSITRNIISGFDVDGISLGEVWGSSLDINRNKITGNNSDNGIIINDTGANQDGVNTAAEVSISHNCFASVQDGIEIETVLDTAFVDANQNDFDGVLDVGIKNAGGGAAKFINGGSNFFGAVPNKSSGNVGIDPELASAPDIDGDGVGDCDDQCYDTPAGEAADASGCSCFQLNPSGDADGDGTIDCADGCPNDPNKTSAGACGCGAADEDADADGIADCNDDCVNGQGNCPLGGGGGCGFCGVGTASMMPFAVIGLMAMHRRRWSCGRRSKRPIPSASRH